MPTTVINIPDRLWERVQRERPDDTTNLDGVVATHLAERLEGGPVATSRALHVIRAMPRSVDDDLTDGLVVLRRPTIADRHVLARYTAEAATLDGGWLPLPRTPEADPEAAAAWLAREFVLGWTSLGGRFGGVLAIDCGEDRLVGIVVLVPLTATTVELGYGVAPSWRGRHIASTAARLASDWALDAGGFDRVEAPIDADHRVSQHVAASAGFVLERSLHTYVEGTGALADDLLYVRTTARPDDPI